jgi:hemerythrin-like metal-binding protein
MKRLISWHDSFSVNNVVIDNQHKKLIDIINNFYEIVRSSSDKNEIARIFDELKSYTNYHFKAEESMLEKVNYVHLESHQLLHQGFIDKLLELETKYMQGKFTVNSEMMGFLRNWLIEHIMTEDKRYMKFINVNEE